MPAWSRLDLGVGLIATEGLDGLWPELADLVDVVEVEPQTLWSGDTGWDHAPSDIDGERDGVHDICREIRRPALDWLRGLDRPLLSHGVGFPVGGTSAPEPAGVRDSARSARSLDAVHWSEHLSFNRSGTGEATRFAGYLLPPIPTEVTVDAAVAHIASFQAEFDRPFLVETPTSYVRPEPGDLTDGQFVAQIAERADCGILLDLHNIWANELNGRQPVEEFLGELPLDRVWEVHLAGGYYLDGIYLDAHVGPIAAELVALAEQVVPTLPNVRALLFEAVPHSFAALGGAGLRDVLGQLRRIATRPPRPPCPRPARPRERRPVEHGTTAAREAQLLAYTTRASDDLAKPDRGADALRLLTDHARLSLLVADHAAPLAALLLDHGRERAGELLREFLASSPASAWRAEQGAAFVRWWNARPGLPQM